MGLIKAGLGAVVCAECGGKKPSGIPRYKCDWQPADPTKAPKFCRECGDIV